MKTTSPILLTLLAFAPAVGAGESPGIEDPNVLAIRGEGVVTHDMFDSRIARIPQEHRFSVLRDRGRLEDLLSNLLLKAQLAAAAREAGLDQDPDVQARMALAAEDELADAWLAHFENNLEAGDYLAMAREYYLVNPGQFQTQLTLDLAHILIATEERDVEAARALADELHARLTQDPGSFDSLVLEYSDDPGARGNRGRYGNVQRGQMVKPFEEVAFNMEVGEISMPVKTQYGFHVIRLDRINEPRQQSFEEARPLLVDRMRRKHRERVRNDYLNQLSSEPTQLTEEDLRAMVRRHFGDDVLSPPSVTTDSE